MDRAVILIGVSQVRGWSQPLKGVENAIDGMRLWALAQRVPENLIVVVTDKDGAVTARQIFDVVNGLPPSIEQVIIYFAGHGIVNARQEFWLLSDAAEAANEAVNLEGSVVLARGGRIGHVVFISDACRTPPQGVTLGRITGSDVFPNIISTNTEKAVDIFFATALGAPALEVRDADSDEVYHAVFSDALLRALNGEVPEAVSEDGFVRPRKLKRVMPDLVMRELNRRKVSILINQTPDARVTSDDDAWIAQVASPPPRVAPPARPNVDIQQVHPGWQADRVGGGGFNRGGGFGAGAGIIFPHPEIEEEEPGPASLEDTVLAILRHLLVIQSGADWHLAAENAEARADNLVARIDRVIHRGDREDMGLEGFRIEGKMLSNVWCPRECVLHTNMAGDRLLEVTGRGDIPVSLLLEFDDGSGALLPYIPGYHCELMFEGGRLEDVTFRRADGAWKAMESRVRLVRQLMAEATRDGAFALDSICSKALNRYLDTLEAFDLSSDIYAAYAFHERGEITPIVDAAARMKERVNGVLFDLLLLGRTLLGEAATAPRMEAPLLAQGWAFIEALGGAATPMLRELRTRRIDSTWTLYDRDGVAMVKEWLSSRS